VIRASHLGEKLKLSLEKTKYLSDATKPVGQKTFIRFIFNDLQASGPTFF